MTALVIRCTGRALDSTGHPIGDPCGAVFNRPQRTAPEPPDGSLGPWSAPVDDAAYVATARAAGWSVHGPHVMCPTCRKPSRDLVALCRDLTESIEGTT